jgi:hypothetical protein
MAIHPLAATLSGVFPRGAVDRVCADRRDPT